MQGSAPVVISIATAYGIGFALGQPLLVTLVGVLVGVAILAFVLVRSPGHEIGRGQGASRAA